MLELKTRDVILAHVNVRAEKHGEDTVPARDLKLTGVMLTKSELNKLVGDRFKYDQMYDVGVKPVEPLWDATEWGPFKWKQKFTECELVLSFGIGQVELTIEDQYPVKVKGIEFTPIVGGLTSMTCTVQGVFALNSALAELDAFLDKTVSLQLTFGEIDEGKGDDKQDELALDHGADTVDETEEEASRKPRARRQPATDAALN